MVLVYTTVGDEDDDEGYDHYCQQLTAKAKIRLRWGLRSGYDRSGCSTTILSSDVVDVVPDKDPPHRERGRRRGYDNETAASARRREIEARRGARRSELRQWRLWPELDAMRWPTLLRPCCSVWGCRW